MEDRARMLVRLPMTDPSPSYWHNPKSPLANTYHGQDGSRQPYDHVIIGSGISGTMIAYNLLKKFPKRRIMMLEAREICSGATGRNGGHTKAASYRSYLQHKEELGKEEALKIAKLEYDNIVETHRLAEELEIECENKLCKTVDIIYDKPTFELGKRAIHALRADVSAEEKTEGKMAWYNIRENVETVSKHFRVSAKNENPVVEDDEIVAGAFEYIAGRVHAYRLTTGVLAECVKMGLQICTNTPVLEIKPKMNVADFMWDVVTSGEGGCLSALNVILATNGYTPLLEKSLQGKIVPMRGQITAQQPGRNTALTAPLPTTFSFIYKNGYEYMIARPLPDGRQDIIIGGGLGRLPQAGVSEFGTVDDRSLNPEISEYLHGSLLGYFGRTNWGEASIEEAADRIVQQWTGIMGATADGRPLVGKVPGDVDSRWVSDASERGARMRNIWISAGFNGHGMALCLKSAEALVKMIENDGLGRNYDEAVDMEGLEWFPKSFLISEERLARCYFKGRTDLLPVE